MHSTVESIESPLDVIIHFSDDDWAQARRDPAWAASAVIKELSKYKEHPETYFAIRPRWICARIPWEERISMEIRGHMITDDREIRFSQWWMFKLLR